jgi:hypothetical protein
MATTDFEGLRENGLEWINFVPYTYNYVTLGGTLHQVAYSSCPQATGFNVIPLNVPEAGQTITTEFTSLKANARLAEGDPIEYHNGDTYVHLENKAFYNNNSKYNAHRGFRLGYVALLNDGTRQYINEDSLYCEGTAETTCEVSMTVPADTKHLWLVVVPAPTSYIQHKWDDNANNDDQWPYRFSLQGTTLGDRAQVYVAPEIDGREVGVQFIGKFNVSNLLCVYGAAVMLGKQPEEILVAMSTLKSVNGRLDPIRSPEGYTAVVDYAHTPDALENVLNAIHEVLDGKGKVITVCGAGGNRDKGKRPLMAQEAVKQSDRVIITSDNPRFEEPQDIINDMLAGLNQKQLKKVISIADRREAIRTACMMAEKGDVILIAGKGHEDYQEIKGVKHHFDDHEVVRECFGAA